MTVSDQIIQVLDALCEKFGVAIDWTSANVIPYLTTLMGKLIQWEIWSSVAWMGIMVVLCLASIVGIKTLGPVFKRKIEAQRSYEMGWEFGAILAIIGLCIFYFATILVICTQIMDIVKCSTFPEMFIFEYIQGLLKPAA